MYLKRLFISPLKPPNFRMITKIRSSVRFDNHRFVGGAQGLKKNASHASLSCDAKALRDAKTKLVLRSDTAQQLSMINKRNDNLTKVKACDISLQQQVCDISKMSAIKEHSDEGRTLIGRDSSKHPTFFYFLVILQKYFVLKLYEIQLLFLST